MSIPDKEYRLIGQHNANMRQIENELLNIKNRTRSIEEKEYDLFSFIRAFQEYIEEGVRLDGYPPVVRQLEGMIDERKQFVMLDEYMDAEFRHTKQQYQAKYEELEKERKNLVANEVRYTEEYQNKLKLLRSGGST